MTINSARTLCRACNAMPFTADVRMGLRWVERIRAV